MYLNATLVKATLEQSLTRSALKQANSTKRFRPICKENLHKYLAFSPYKNMVVQGLISPDLQNRVNYTYVSYQNQRSSKVIKATFIGLQL